MPRRACPVTSRRVMLGNTGLFSRRARSSRVCSARQHDAAPLASRPACRARASDICGNNNGRCRIRGLGRILRLLCFDAVAHRCRAVHVREAIAGEFFVFQTLVYMRCCCHMLRAARMEVLQYVSSRLCRFSTRGVGRTQAWHREAGIWWVHVI